MKMVVCTLIRRVWIVEINDLVLEINPFLLMHLPEIALHSVHWPHRHLHCLFQFTPSHHISLGTILVLNLSIHLYIDIPRCLFPSHFFYQKPVCNNLLSDTVLLIATLTRILWARVSELIRLPPLKSISTPFSDMKYESGSTLMKRSVLSWCVTV